MPKVRRPTGFFSSLRLSLSIMLCFSSFLNQVTRRTFDASTTIYAFSILPSSWGLGHAIRQRNQSLSTNTKPSKQMKVKSYAKRHRFKGETLYRADRVLANRSGLSRKECFELLHKKRITHFNQMSNCRQVVLGPTCKLSMNAQLYIDNKEEVPLPPPLLMVYHKPKWVLSVRSDPMKRPCVDTILPKLHPVGRLDYDTSGLLLFSSSGVLTQLLLHPKHEVTKEYVAVVQGTVHHDDIAAQLEQGVTTGEGVHTAKLLESTCWESKDVAPYLQETKTQLPSQYNKTDLQDRGYLDVLHSQELSTVRLQVQEGKHRMVRRILANIGHPVVNLKRERFGAIELGSLPEGETRQLHDEELEWAKSILPQREGRRRNSKKLG